MGKLDDDWRLIETLVAKDTKDRGKLSQSEADELRSRLRGMVAQPDGRQRISLRLTNKEPFPGK